jgi:hypothetical protein
VTGHSCLIDRDARATGSHATFSDEVFSRILRTRIADINANDVATTGIR